MAVNEQDIKHALNNTNASHWFFHWKEMLQSPTIQDDVGDGGRDIYRNTQQVQKIFVRVTRHLIKIDNEKFQNRDGVILQLLPQWIPHHERFKMLLTTSQRNAVRAAAFLSQYDALLAYASHDDATLQIYDAVKSELKSFMATLRQNVALAEETKDNFRKLAEDIRSFKESVDHVLQTTEGHLSEMLNAARNELATLRTQLEEVSQKVPQLSVAEHVSSLVIGTAVTMAIGMISPAFMDHVLNNFAIQVKPAIAAAMYTKRKKHSLELKLERCINKIKDVRSQIATSTLHKMSLDTDIDKLTRKLDVFINIWSSLSADMLFFENQLDLVVGSETEAVTKVFGYKIRATRELYKTLSDTLILYAKKCPSNLS